jgi:hypothetical protein
MRNLTAGFLYHPAMPISHVCTGCGVDLADRRARPEPHYGLWVVVCPGCRVAAVRTRGPLITGYRFARRCLAAGTLAFLHVVVLGVLSLAFNVVALAQAARWIDPSVRRLTTDPDAPLLTILIVTASLAGLWLGLTVIHRSVLARVGLWLGILAVPLSIISLMVLLTRPLRETTAASVEDHPMFLVSAYAVAAGSAFIVVLAEAPASVGRFLARTMRSSLFRWRRERVRRRRSGS